MTTCQRRAKQADNIDEQWITRGLVAQAGAANNARDTDRIPPDAIF
jgi:hypothetical protein